MVGPHVLWAYIYCGHGRPTYVVGVIGPHIVLEAHMHSRPTYIVDMVGPRMLWA